MSNITTLLIGKMDFYGRIIKNYFKGEILWNVTTAILKWE